MLGPRRAAWIGIYLSIQLPLLVCQYVYMDAWALPKWNKTEWTTSVSYEDPMMPPAILIVQSQRDEVAFANVNGAYGRCHNRTASDCDKNMSWNNHYSDENTNISYHMFNPISPQATLRDQDNLRIDINVTWDGRNGDADPWLYFVLIDPRLIDDLPDLLPTLWPSSCDFLTAQYLPTIGTNYIYVERFDIDDSRGALSKKRSLATCNKQKKEYRNYSSYRWTATHIGLTDASSCNVSGKAYKNNSSPCPSSTRIIIPNHMVTKRSSQRKTDKLKMITDEASIAGGVLFFTWFLGIYIV